MKLFLFNLFAKKHCHILIENKTAYEQNRKGLQQARRTVSVFIHVTRASGVGPIQLL